MVGLLALSILPVEWQHANGKPVILCLFCHIKSCTGAHLDNKLFVFFSIQGLSLEEMADMPSCNLSETAHNKWLQQFGNCGNDLFAATCDDKIRAVMQMTNYRAYLKDKASGTGPSKQELKLKAAKHSGDPKKIEEALSQLPEVDVATTRILHLEGEEIFGSTKRKLDLPLGDDSDFHRPDKVNFLQP
jgi:hypothetical protein